MGDLLPALDFGFERLSDRLNGQMRDWRERDGDVYWYYLHGKLNELRHLAQEIAEDYASDEV